MMQRQKAARKDKKERHCLCRSTNSSGFMVQCEKCLVWFHGRCINLSPQEANNIPHYFCDKCTNSISRCQNPDCCNEVRGETEVDVSNVVNGLIVHSKKSVQSKYCSDACAEQINRIRYEKFYLPKWKELKNNPSTVRSNKLAELNRIDEDLKETMSKIGRLRRERDELDRMIKLIKSEAAQLREKEGSDKEMSIEKDSDEDDEESGAKQERVYEQSKTFCVTCGTEQVAEKAFKHWYQCHKKQESAYNFTSEEKYSAKEICKEDPYPKIYCEHPTEKKGKITRYCMHIASACPQHSNWNPTKDEVCGCPSDVMQELKLDGNYCLELKSECNQHYNWEKFRLATKDMERIQEFNRLENLNSRINQLTINLRDTYGGVLGVMLHDTKDYGSNSNIDDENIKLEVT